ncbi:BamA/TamA family outer membrane protein [candidate division KSB1 bacterium]|nr:BamA/TamA family outer membrane protein [candidate division KSB1 bacterium]
MRFCVPLTVALSIFLASVARPQTADIAHDYAKYQGRIISKIIVLGNDKTRDIVILREMKTKVGVPFDANRVDEDRKRIQNLSLFTRVEIYPAKDENEKVGLIVIVAERWHFLPYPLFFRNEREWELEKWSYGAGIIHNNVRGLNNKLLAELWFGYNPGGTASYLNPWFAGERQLYYKATLYSMTLKSKTLKTPRFDEFHRGFSFIFGKKWGYHTYSNIAVSYDYIRIPYEYRYLISSESDQHVPSIGIGFQYDTRDLQEYPRDGWWMSFGVTGNFPPQSGYQLFGADVRRYIRLYKDISLALRVDVDLAHGDTPFYSHYYLGYSERMRGQFYTAMEGDRRSIFMAECRFPIVPVHFINLDYGQPMLGQYANDLPFGISAGIFYDIGAAWFRDDANIPTDFLSGFGMGLHFHLPYIELFRIEYGIDPQWKGQFIIDTKVAF